MRRSFPLTYILGVVLLGHLLTGLATPRAARAATVLPVGPFRSVVLHRGGQVILRHAASQRVTLLEGSNRFTHVAVDADRTLVIEGCPDGCPRGYDVTIEVSTPSVDEVMVTDGGSLRSVGVFPGQDELRAEVREGGTLDLRSLRPDRVSAAVHSGGGIFVNPQATLDARIAQGGVITYWGKPHVRSSVEQGGAVVRGRARDAERPVDEIGTHDSVPPPVPPVPPVPPEPPAGTSGSS